MILILLSILRHKLFWFYFSIFLSVIIYKKVFRSRIVINTIWFSYNGYIPANVIHNLVEVAKQIKRSHYKKNYTLFFWTDTSTLQSTIKSTLKKSGVVIKDYRNISPLDEPSKNMNTWVKELILLGDEENKFFFTLASDIFRLYLLLKEFPNHYKNSYTCYIDCNDIYLADIPNPVKLRRLKTIAFHFIDMDFIDDIYAFLAINNLSRPYVTNDVILTVNKNKHPFFDDLFKSYYTNLIIINTLIHHFSFNLKQDINIAKLSKMDTFIIVFTTTHLMNLISCSQNHDKLYLLKFKDDDITEEQINQVEDVSKYINFIRDQDQGLTWINHDSDAHPLHEKVLFWREVFSKRFHLIEKFRDS